MLRGESDIVVKRIMAFLPICFSLVALPSFAVSDPDPSDSSYTIQEDVSILSVPLADTLATRSSANQLHLTMPNGQWFVYYQMTGMDDINLQNAINGNIIETRNFFYDYGQDIQNLKAAVSSSLTQSELQSSLDSVWKSSGDFLNLDGSIATADLYPKDWLRVGLMGLAAKMGLGFPDGSSLFVGKRYNPGAWYISDSYASVSGYGDNRTPTVHNWYYMLNSIVASLSGVNVGGKDLILSPGGLVTVSKSENLLSDVNRTGFLGLAYLLRGSSGSSLSGSLLNYSDLSSFSYSSNNILGAFKPLFDIQNDLARLTHVIADPTEQALHDATKDNVQAVTDNLTGSNGVTPSAVGDVAGISSGVGSFMDSGVDSSRLSDSLSDSSNFSFFSHQTANDLDTVTSVRSYSGDDYIDFYALNRDAYRKELGD